MSQQINLYNPIFLTEKKYFSAIAMLQAGALVLGGLLVFALLASRQTASLERMLADSQRESTQRREQLVVLARQFSGQGTSKQLELDLARAEERLRKRSDLLSEMSTGVGANVLGYSGFLTALARRAVQGVWLTGVEFGGNSNEIVIKGRALNAELVPAYVSALREEQVFAGRALVSLQITARETNAAAAPQPADGAVAQPSRYLEFTLSIPLGEARGEGKGAAS